MKPGDQVQAAGYPVMEVVAISDHRVCCEWLDDKCIRHVATFNERDLRRVTFGVHPAGSVEQPRAVGLGN